MEAFGADNKDFYDNHFPAGWYVDDVDETLPEKPDGSLDLDPAEKYDLDRFGYISPEDPEKRDETMLFSQAFSKWFRSKGTETLVVRVKKGRKAEALKLLKSNGFI